MSMNSDPTARTRSGILEFGGSLLYAAAPAGALIVGAAFLTQPAAAASAPRTEVAQTSAAAAQDTDGWPRVISVYPQDEGRMTVNDLLGKNGRAVQTKDWDILRREVTWELGTGIADGTTLKVAASIGIPDEILKGDEAERHAANLRAADLTREAAVQLEMVAGGEGPIRVYPTYGLYNMALYITRQKPIGDATLPVNFANALLPVRPAFKPFPEYPPAW